MAERAQPEQNHDNSEEFPDILPLSLPPPLELIRGETENVIRWNRGETISVARVLPPPLTPLRSDTEMNGRERMMLDCIQRIVRVNVSQTNNINLLHNRVRRLERAMRRRHGRTSSRSTRSTRSHSREISA